jgi:hypothetical protein
MQCIEHRDLDFQLREKVTPREALEIKGGLLFRVHPQA